MKRRDFLKSTTLASGVFLIPSFLKPFESLALDELSGYKNLVIVQLSGGNDGLNTVVPYGMDVYYQKRRSIALPQSELIRLDDLQGLNPNMGALREIYDQGWMTVVNSVGYPNPDRSHFRSMDIWQTASNSDEYLTTGWIGRYLDSNCQSCKDPYAAIEVDDTLSLALKGKSSKGIAVKDPAKLYNNTREPFFREVIENHDKHLNEDNLGYLYKTMIETYSSAGYIQKTSKTYESKGDYPQTGFANQLKTVSRFINSGLKTRVYYVSLSGFDTHTGQKDQQGRLLKQYSEGMAAFLNELKSTGKLNDTLVLTFSEFGRRVEQNASNGTDHGTANNVFVFSGKLKKPGIYNDAPDLNNLDNGDLKYKIDFRQVYATVLDKWLDVNNSNILNRQFSGLDFI
ncbi:uncharacterized protein (DUF1501 family) [Arcticibacter tournemirensis]|uniref:DUF1501 domain-containing protein n=1 Tax=Arcticibacter tournemirensis TaxID=699437 RepID=A0A5M9GYR5_9SPHI|nr:DUF1501 domain-containing protein [Arcticibacter tournemirensis]KAA8477934.1 DUF1501 domain-containing protein [Arcticibacter tournemirensis]TQM48443.1 uncharacterized protein (DUF1501 family) [Arcticibacter tournemirensis]